MKYTIQDIPIEERPRERLLRLGSEAMSTTELLAILLGSGMRGKPVLQLSQELLARFSSLRGLAEASVPELCAVKGLGQAKAIQLKAAFSLATKIARQQAALRYRIDQPIHAYQLVKEELEDAAEERFLVILQDSKGYVIRHETVSIGTLNRTLVHPREVFYPAIRHKAASLVLVHNHPSGDPSPSKEDHQITRQLVEAGRLIGIQVNDHLIIGHGSYVSLRERGEWI